MPKNSPSTHSQGPARDFWTKHSISPDSSGTKKKSSEIMPLKKIIQTQLEDFNPVKKIYYAMKDTMFANPTPKETISEDLLGAKIINPKTLKKPKYR